jgi:AcrR family transcriptional regulator
MVRAKRLPRGRHGLTREEVRASQRGRMLDAVSEIVGERGYVGTTVAQVIARAGVSRETFYEHFADRQDCYLAAFDANVDDLLGSMSGVALDAPRDPVARLDRALAAYFAALTARPAHARAFLVEVYGAGPAAVARHEALQQRFVDGVALLLGLDDAAAGSTERFACEALVAAISSLVTARIGAGGPPALDELRAPITDLVRRAGLPVALRVAS